MKKERNMFQLKKQDKTSEKDLNEMEISGLPDKELKIMVIKGGRVKMAVWEDVKLASPHNKGTCRPLVGDSEAQGAGRNPKVNW